MWFRVSVLVFTGVSIFCLSTVSFSQELSEQEICIGWFGTTYCDNLDLQQQSAIWNSEYSMPTDRDHDLREENVADDEILQIKRLVRGLVPDAIVSIGSIWSGCDCSDRACDNQVWVFATNPEKITGILLSERKRQWFLGQTQEWYLVRDELQTGLDAISAKRYQAGGEELLELERTHLSLVLKKFLHLEKYPECKSASG